MIPSNHVHKIEVSKTHAVNMTQNNFYIVMVWVNFIYYFNCHFLLFFTVSYSDYPSALPWMISHPATTIAITPSSTSPFLAFRAPNRDTFLLLPWTCWNNMEAERRSLRARSWLPVAPLTCGGRAVAARGPCWAQMWMEGDPRGTTWTTRLGWEATLQTVGTALSKKKGTSGRTTRASRALGTTFTATGAATAPPVTLFWPTPVESGARWKVRATFTASSALNRKTKQPTRGRPDPSTEAWQGASVTAVWIIAGPIPESVTITCPEKRITAPAVDPARISFNQQSLKPPGSMGRPPLRPGRAGGKWWPTLWLQPRGATNCRVPPPAPPVGRTPRSWTPSPTPSSASGRKGSPWFPALIPPAWAGTLGRGRQKALDLPSRGTAAHSIRIPTCPPSPPPHPLTPRLWHRSPLHPRRPTSCLLFSVLLPRPDPLPLTPPPKQTPPASSGAPDTLSSRAAKPSVLSSFSLPTFRLFLPSMLLGWSGSCHCWHTATHSPRPTWATWRATWEVSGWASGWF